MPFETNNRAGVSVVDDDASLRGALESLFDSVGLDSRTGSPTRRAAMRRRQPRTPPPYCSSRRALVRAIYGNGKPPIAWQKSWRGSNQSRLIRSQGAEKRSLQ